MSRSAVLLALLMLAACSGTTPRMAAAPPSPQERACADGADQDPAVQQFRAISAGNLDWQWQHGPELEQIKRDAITRCLRARGLAPRGGVERPR